MFSFIAYCVAADIDALNNFMHVFALLNLTGTK